MPMGHWVLDEAVALRMGTRVTAAAGLPQPAPTCLPPLQPRLDGLFFPACALLFSFVLEFAGHCSVVTNENCPCHHSRGGKFRAEDHLMILPGPDPRPLFPLGLSHAIHNGGLGHLCRHRTLSSAAWITLSAMVLALAWF